MEGSSEIGSWALHGEFFRDQAPGADVSTSVYVRVKARVVSAFRQVPPMNPSRASLHGKLPVSWTIFLGGPALGCGVQRKHSAESVILSPQEAEDGRQRRFAPMRRAFRRLQPRHNTRNVTCHLHHPC